MTTDEAHEALLEFARLYARRSAGGPDCACVPCRAVRAVAVIDGVPYLEPVCDCVDDEDRGGNRFVDSTGCPVHDLTPGR